jgi:hypothetical protein
MLFTLDQLHAVKTLVCHGPACPDGIASAILLHDVLPDAEVKFVQYQTPEQLELPATTGMLFCDFSPHPDRTQRFVDVGAIVLDHHKTAKDVVAAFGPLGAFGDEKADPGVCGAVLAYRHVWLPIKQAQYKAAVAASHDGGNDAGYLYEGQFSRAEKFAGVAGVRDTWLNQDPRWEEAVIQAEALRFYPIEHWLSLKEPFRFENEHWWTERKKLGEILIQRHGASCKRAIEKAWRFTSKNGTRVIMFEGTAQSSDAAELLDKEVDLVIGFGFVVEGEIPKMIFSMRSHTGYDCSTFAKRFGGGGHTAAAGFNAPIKQSPYDFAELLVNDHEHQAENPKKDSPQ